MGVVIECWCPTQQMLGVFLEETEVKKLLLVGSALLLMVTSASAQYCSSWQICAYRAHHPELYSKWGIRNYRALPRDEQVLANRNYERAFRIRHGR